jgi:hypothetical protein
MGVNKKHSDDGSGIPDAVLDQALREMLDVEPPPNFRRRVLTRIDAPANRLRWMWIAVPAAAALVLAVLLLPRGNDARIPRQVVGPIAPPAVVTAPRHPVTPQMTAADSSPSAGRTRTARAAVANEPPPADEERAVAALEAPSPIETPDIGAGRATPVTSIQVVPIGLKPLDVDALNDSPQERH